MRLEYVRYVCLSCGESDTTAMLAHSDSGSASSDESERTEWATQGRNGHRNRLDRTSTRKSRPPITSRYQSSGDLRIGRPSGFELCSECIETNGITHTRAFKGKGGSDHTFREMIWGPQGWADVGMYHKVQRDPRSAETCRISGRYGMQHMRSANLHLSLQV